MIVNTLHTASHVVGTDFSSLNPQKERIWYQNLISNQSPIENQPGGKNTLSHSIKNVKEKSILWVYYKNSHLMCVWPCLASLALNKVPWQYRVLTCGVLLKANIKGQFVSGRPGGGETAQILKIQDQSSPRNVHSPPEATVINAAIDMDEQVYLQSVDSEAYGHIPTHGRAESYGYFIFIFLEEPPHRFPRWLQSLHSHNWPIRAPVSPQSP